MIKEKSKRNKRAQEEMVGFVLIVLLVVVIGLIFLGYSLRQKPPEKASSKEVENLLNALVQQTTKCAIYFEPQYSNIADLAKSCYEGERCSNLDKSACEYLKEQINSTLAAAMPHLKEGDIKGYNLNITATTTNGMQTSILSIKAGNLSGRYIGASQPISLDKGKLEIFLVFFY